MLLQHSTCAARSASASTALTKFCVSANSVSCYCLVNLYLAGHAAA